MANKSCCLKLKGCFGKAKVTNPGQTEFLNGVESGLLPIIEADLMTPKQETEFVGLVDNVVGAGNNLTKFDAAMTDLMTFGMDVANQ